MFLGVFNRFVFFNAICLLDGKPKLKIIVCIFSGRLSFILPFKAAGPTAGTSSLSFSPAVSEVEGRPISFVLVGFFCSVVTKRSTFFNFLRSKHKQ